MSFIPSESFGVNLVRNTPHGELHAEWHMKLCRAVDMLGLAVVFNEMVEAGHISRRQADAFEAQAGGLLATMLSECARSFIGSPSQSTIETIRLYGVEAKNGLPEGVRYSVEHDNFYDEKGTGLGNAFHAEWKAKRHLFPRAVP